MTTETGAPAAATGSLSSGALLEDVPALAAMDPADPYQAYPEIFGPAFEVPGRDVVVVTEFATCSELLRHPDVSLQRSESPAFRGLSSGFFAVLDPPAHTRLRGLVSKAFTPRSIEALKPWLEDQVDTMLDAAVGRNEFDVVSGLSYPLPLYTICHLLGVPEEDREEVMQWSKPITFGIDLLAGRRTREEQHAYRTALREFRLYSKELLARRREEPGDDLLTRLIEAEEDGQRLTEREILINVVGLLVAGHETTVSLLTHGAMALVRRPELRAGVASDPAAADAFIDEVMRYDSPIQVAMRIAARDIRVDDLDVRSGTAFLLLVGAANRDPAEFDRPDEFLVDRPNNRNHLGFGLGRHYCLGAALARMEARAVLSALARRLVEPREREDGSSYERNKMLRTVNRYELDVADVLPRTSPVSAA